MEKKNSEFGYDQREIKVINSGKDVLKFPNNLALFVHSNKISLYEIDFKTLKYKLITIYEYNDEESILTVEKFNKLSIGTNTTKKNSNNLYIIGKSNKKIDLFSQIDKNFTLISSYNHVKKVSTFIEVYDNNSKNKIYNIYSDKFGEIYIKQLSMSLKENKIVNEEQFEGKGKLLSGHADMITLMKKSKNNKLFMTSDDFGRIKIYEFPNLFNVLGVILYKSNTIKYIDFIGNFDKGILVLNNLHEIHLWSCYDFIMKNKCKVDIKDDEDDIISIKVSKKNNIIFMESKEKLLVYAYNDNDFTIKKIKDISKKEINDKVKEVKYSKIFIIKDNEYYALFNEKNELIHIQSI